MYEIKTEDVYEEFSRDKEMLDFSNCWTKSKYYDDSNKLVTGNMKNEPAGVVIEEFVGLKPKMYWFLVDYNSQHKKAKGRNKNNAATISHNDYKKILLDNKCMRHSMNRIRGKDHRIGTFEIMKVSLSCFDDKIYTQNNGFDGLALGYQS